MSIFTEGFILQASLILALGAQNIFVINVGLKRNYHILAATICALCDVILILLGVLGVSALLVNAPIFKIIIGALGTAFLMYYAISKFLEAYKGFPSKRMSESEQLSKKLVVMATLGFTLLNPHVYIDTFFLVGGYSTRFETLSEKLIFGLGAGAFSTIWFYFLALFSSKFSHILTSEKNLRVISLFTGILLGYLSYSLGSDLYREILLVMKMR